MPKFGTVLVPQMHLQPVMLFMNSMLEPTHALISNCEVLVLKYISFAVVWNKQNTGLHTAKEENLKFADEQVHITFFGEMEIPAGSEQAGICFACQAPSEERVRLAIIAHEKKTKVYILIYLTNYMSGDRTNYLMFANRESGI